MKLKTTQQKLSAYIKAWEKRPNKGYQYLAKITAVVNEANESKSKRLERYKMKRVKKVVARLLGETPKGYVP